MAYFPFMIEVSNQNCLVVGGGRIALHKVKKLLGFGVNITVVGQKICQELYSVKKEQEISGKSGAGKAGGPSGSSKVEIRERDFQDSDLENMDFVVAATDDEKMNRYISDLCRQKNILINVVDVKDACSFIFPAIIQEKDLMIAVSSGGQSPAAAAYVKKKIQGSIPKYYGDMVEILGGYRDYILENTDSPKKRKEIFYKLLEYGDAHCGEIPKKVVEKVVQEGQE